MRKLLVLFTIFLIVITTQAQVATKNAVTIEKQDYQALAEKAHRISNIGTIMVGGGIVLVAAGFFVNVETGNTNTPYSVIQQEM